VDKLSSELCCALDTTSPRVIFKGRNLSGDNQGNNNVRKIVSSNDGQEEQRRNNEILCIVSGHGYISAMPITTDNDTIDSIRCATAMIPQKNGLSGLKSCVREITIVLSTRQS
jgi:hypothetical protein